MGLRFEVCRGALTSLVGDLPPAPENSDPVLEYGVSWQVLLRTDPVFDQTAKYVTELESKVKTQLKARPVYTGPDKYGTGPLLDMNRSVAKRSHESGQKLFQIARPFT